MALGSSSSSPLDGGAPPFEMPGTSRVTDAPPAADPGAAPALSAMAPVAGGTAVPVGGGGTVAGESNSPPEDPGRKPTTGARPPSGAERTSTLMEPQAGGAGVHPFLPGRTAPKRGAALWPSPRRRGGQFIGNLSLRDPNGPGAASTNGRAVAGGGRAAATGITASVRGHSGRGGSGPVAEDHPGPLVTGRAVRGGWVVAQPAGGRRSRGSRTTSGGGRPRAPAPLGPGVP